MNSDGAFDTFTRIVGEIRDNIHNIATEEDAKVQIILRLLTEVLGWRHSDICTERKHDNGYSDFIVSDNSTPIFLLEAKRIGEITIDTSETTRLRHLKLAGPTLTKAQDGIDQAEGYAAPNGITIAALTDGTKWIIFKTFTSGSPFKSNDAFVFPSLHALSNDFATFYELLSKECVAKKLYNRRFDELHNRRSFLTQALIAPIPDAEVRIKRKSDLAFDLDQVFESFFSRLAGQHDTDMLVECFVETRESRVADLALEKITANVLGNISSTNKDVDAELSALIESAVSAESGQTVFIVGPTGAGKTTFLERFFQKTLSSTLRRQCVVVRVNCLDSTGNEEHVLNWLTEVLIKNFENQLYTSGSPSWDDLQGLYYSEYERRRIGVDSHLYERNKQAFKEKFAAYLEHMVERDREGYLRRLLADIVTNRKKLPILLIDNTDEFSAEFKRNVFQFSQALRREANHCVAIFPVTDKSAWAFSKTDLYGIYKSKSFFLPTPPPREVFRKRIDFIKEKIKSLGSVEAQRAYLVGKGIKLSIANIFGFASVIEEIFVDHDYTAKTIGELSNFNIRRTLELSQRTITSSMFRIEDLLTAFAVGKMVAPTFGKFLNALLKGDYDLYKQTDRHHIFPLFQVDDQIRQSPLLYLRILALLEARRNSARTVDERHLTAMSVSNYFDSMDVVEASLDCALLRLLQAGLLEAYDPSIQDLTPGQRLAITYSGTRHLNLALYAAEFFEQMAVTTAIANYDTAERIRGAFLSERKYPEKMSEVRRMFAEYLIQEDATYVTVPAEGDQYDNQRQIAVAIRKFAHSRIDGREDDVQKTEDVRVLSGVLSTVDWFDVEKGFGFVDVEGLDDQAFLRVDKLTCLGLDRVFDGDKLLCDIGKNAKGFFVKGIHDCETTRDNIEDVQAEVIKLFPDRRYGFVKIADGTRDAFLHFSVLQHTDNLHVGLKLRVEISPDKSGVGYLVRKVKSYE